MAKSSIIAALAGAGLLVSAMAPVQAAMVSVPGAAAGHDVQNPLIQKTQRRRRGGVRRGPGRRGRRGRGAAVGAGIALGVLGAIALSEAAARDREHRRRCRRWGRQCYDGSRRACWNYDDRC
jgi:hypothetical protein